MSSTINQDSILSGKISTQEVPLSGKVSTQEMLLSGKVATLETLIGPPGPQGPKGDPGDSYTVKGLYTTLSALQAAHPMGSEGDAWFVGTSDSNVVYQWDVDQAAWVNVGALKGPKGDKGDTGDTGPQGPQGDKGETGAAGADGKSAYASAKDGGYTGTEAQFNTDLAAVSDKQAKITASGILKGDGAGNVSGATPGTDYVASPEIFWATYGVTTFSEIKEAYDAGKLLMLKVPEDDSIALLKSYYYDEVLASAVVFAISGIRVRRTYVEEFTLDPHSNEWRTDFIRVDYSSYATSATLTAAGWDADAKTQTVSVAGVTATANCIITAAPDSYMAYAEAGVRCTAQGAGTLTFACETVPTADVAANVLILG